MLESVKNAYFLSVIIIHKVASAKWFEGFLLPTAL